MSVLVGGGDPVHELTFRGDIPLPDVEQDQDRLLGEEPEAADGLGLVGVELEVADRLAGLQARVDPPQDDLLALGRLALRLRPVAPAALESLQAPLGHRQVGQDELEVELLKVARRIDTAGGMRMDGVVEGANDVEEGVRIAQPREVVGRKLLRADAPLRRGRRRGQVHVRDIGVDGLPWLEDGSEPVESVIRDLHDPDVEGDAPVATGLGVPAGQGVEDGGLAAPGKTDDGGLHGTDRTGASDTAPSVAAGRREFVAPGQ